jgi:hypothetical protein
MYYNQRSIPSNMALAALYDHRTTFYLAEHTLNGLPPGEHMQKLLGEAQDICTRAGARQVDYREEKAGKQVLGYRSAYILGGITITNHVALIHPMRLGTPKGKKKTGISQNTEVHVDEMTLDQLVADRVLAGFDTYYPRKVEQNGKRGVALVEVHLPTVEPDYRGQLKLF